MSITWSSFGAKQAPVIMPQKHRTQAMPDTRVSRVSRHTQINPGKAGPKGALGVPPGSTSRPPKSGPKGNEGNNTRRDFANGPRLKNK
jgi:hypothetical protein